MNKTTLAYIVHDEKVLFLERSKRKEDIHYGKYVVPGGKFLPGEKPHECMIREVFEETGLRVESYVLKGEIDFLGFNDGEDVYCYIYYVDQFSGELRENEEGFLKWVSIDAIANLPQWDGDLIFLPWVLHGAQRFRADFLYEDGIFKEYTVSWRKDESENTHSL